MSTEADRLQGLVETGCLVSDETVGGIRSLPIHAELISNGSDGGTLYWVEANAEHQGHTHARRYDAASVVYGRDLSLTAAGEPVAYVAPITEWPQESTDDLNERLAMARAELAGPGRAAFAAFVEANRPKLGLN